MEEIETEKSNWKGLALNRKENPILSDLRKESKMGVDAGVGRKFIAHIYYL